MEYLFSNVFSCHFPVAQKIRRASTKVQEKCPYMEQVQEKCPYMEQVAWFFVKRKMVFKEIRKTILENFGYANFLSIHIWQLF